MDQRYSLLRQLGSGGQGQVFLVRDERRQGRCVVLKRIANNSGGSEDLALEFDHLARLRHPNLARAYDFAVDDEGPYFTSEYVDGPDILAWSRTADQRTVLQAMAALLRVLAMLHDRELVHGDISPNNVLVTGVGYEVDTPKLLDLGSARRPGQSGGAATPAFAAPEVILDKGLKISSDLYSFGVLLACAMFRKSPFGEGDASTRLARQLEGELDLPDPSLSPIAGLCQDLIQLDSALRPKSARDTLARLANAAGFSLGVDLAQLRGGDLSAPSFIGRQVEFAGLMALIDRVDRDTGSRVARIQGALGSGKSALLSEVTRAAQLMGLRTIGRFGSPTSSEDLLGSIVRAASAAFKSSPSGQILSPWAGMTDPPQAPTITESWHESICFAAAEALADIASRHPVLVIIDDFHLAGALVQTVARAFARALSPDRHARPSAVLLVAGDLDDGGQDAWQALEGPVFSLGPLDKPSIQTLVASMLPGISHSPALADGVYLASNGMPGLAEYYVRQSAGSHQNTDIESIVALRVRTMEMDAQQVLATLAVVGEAYPPSILAHIGGDRDRLDGLLRDGFLLECNTPEGPYIRATHSAGLAAVDQVAPDVIQHCAKKLARHLSAGGSLALAAHLWQKAGEMASASKAYATLASACLDQGDLAGAGEWFEKALFSNDAGRDTPALAVRAIDTWQALGRFDLALRAVQQTQMTAHAQACLRAELTFEQGRHREALAMARDISSGADTDLSIARVIAMAELQLGRPEQSLITSRSALKQARCSGEKTGVGVARLAQVAALACIYLGRVDDALPLLAEADREFEKGGDAVGKIKVLAAQGMVARRLGHLVEAHGLYDQAVDLAHRIGDRTREGLHLLNRAAVALVSGDISAAHQDYLLALDIAIVLGNDFARAQVEINLADLYSGVGDQKSAVETAGHAIERCRRLGQDRLETRASLVSAVGMLRAGALHRAEPRLIEVKRRFKASGDDEGLLTADLHLAGLGLAKNDSEGALRMAEDVGQRAGDQNRQGQQARALVLMARAMGRSGQNVDRALSLLDKAEQLFEAERLQDEMWRLKVHRAHLLEQLGRSAQATDARDEAQDMFEKVLEKVPPDLKPFFISFEEAARLDDPVWAKDKAQSTHRLVRDLNQLMEINRELTREHNPKRLLSLIMKYAVEITGAERGIIVMPKGDILEPVIAHQISDAVDINFSRSVAEKVVSEGQAVLAIDAMGDDRFRTFSSVHAMKLRSILVVPLKIRDRGIGVVYLDSRLKSGVFSETDRSLLEAFGDQAAIALETARLVSENARRLAELQEANQEIRDLTSKLEEKLERKEATLRRVGALLQKTQKGEAERLRRAGIVGRSPAMQRVMDMIDRIALTDVPIYIFGASGTGKELVAKAIHAQSERAEHPFLPVNCGALPTQLLSSELFGHKKGAFTGAVGDRPGLFQLANQGTLFLDEVTDMDAEMQAHLLRVLQDGIFRPLGGNEEIWSDVRILSASNQDLKEAVDSGRFREDLFYRLNVVRIDVPTLSERREDIPLLAEHFIGRHSGNRVPDISKEAMDILMQADWPGNVRELENEVLRAMALATAGCPIQPEDLSSRLTSEHLYNNNNNTSPSALGSKSGTLKERVDAFERLVIQRVLAECNGNATSASKQLGISRAGLYKKLEKHQIAR
ncbi:MAG: sigma 54-interacting transcriptional regulator [Myxococcota bacterium]|nr:sigma 54-interacting transcriptional regulator [Myxococcota bacterium]